VDRLGGGDDLCRDQLVITSPNYQQWTGEPAGPPASGISVVPYVRYGPDNFGVQLRGDRRESIQFCVSGEWRRLSTETPELFWSHFAQGPEHLDGFVGHPGSGYGDGGKYDYA